MINASLFALIQNDAFLSGTYGLEGHRFVNTIHYLKEYFETLKKGSEPLSPEHLELIQNTEYLVSVEKDLEANFLGSISSKTPEQISAKIAEDLKNLPIGGKILLPGGWHNKDGGHAMVYQFTRETDGYRFTVYNSGDGIRYHAKKSIVDKELYNPTKAWFVPFPRTVKGKVEVAHFIERLLKARLPAPSGQHTKVMTSTVLYEEILPSISYIQGIEVNVNRKFPEHAYTGGQLSGTCAQRCIHQMCKVNSNCEESYQRFIFKFKIYALSDYANACFSGKQPFSPAVADQIYLAIDNNLKILNTPGLFMESETDSYFNYLTNLKQTVKKSCFTVKLEPPTLTDKSPQLTLMDNPLVNPVSSYSSSDVYVPMSMPIELKNGTNLLVNIEKAIKNIKSIRDSAAQYLYLEKLILSLPINQNARFDPFYSELNTLENYTRFQTNIHEIQDLLNILREKWLKDAQSARFNHLVLSILALQVDTYEVIAVKSHLPSFKAGTNTMMSSLIDNHHRDPFEATNHPIFDRRISILRDRFSNQPSISESEFHTYLKDILFTEPKLNQELKELYHKDYGQITTRLHKEIRENGLETLFLISLHLKNEKFLGSNFNPIIDKIKLHYLYESRLREAINPFFKHHLSATVKISLDFLHDKFFVVSPLYPTYVAYQNLSKSITQHKYLLNDSPARDALEADLPNVPATSKEVIVRTANNIQLSPEKAGNADEPHQVTQADIVARDYHHLRSNPSMQIALTIDYFTRNIHKLADKANQLYVEANLFQPGLLLEATRGTIFIDQFDNFLKTGKRFFGQNGQYTCDSLQFLRLDFLVSRYMAQGNLPKGISRLQQIYDDLKKQLVLSQDSDVIYVLQQYLFLASMVRIEAGESSSELFGQAFNAYFYLMGHTNPSIYEDTAHNIDVGNAIVQFKVIASQQSEVTLKEAVKTALTHNNLATKSELTGKFPTYKVTHEGKMSEVNVASGKLFERGLSRGGVPIAIRNHPLIKQLGLQDVWECLLNANETFMILKHKNEEIFLFYQNDHLTIQKEWTVHGKTQKYELQALTSTHLAKYANKSIYAIAVDLPKPMIDGSMNYWKGVTNRYENLLTCNNVPAYSFNGSIFKLLDERGEESSYHLSSINPKWRALLNTFESNSFLLSYQNSKNNKNNVKFPRFGLSFIIDEHADTIVHQETEEQVVACPSPVHSAVAGLVLQGQGQTRYLVPVERFYSTENGAQTSDFYPLIHDTNGTIANATLAEYWKSKPPLQMPMWHYQNSEKYVSFQLKNGEPIADKPADALYLAYMYLATNQTEKAWKTLEECITRLGGLKGDLDELQYISWICKDLPHILPSDKSEFEKSKTVRSTPPYVACQLKAMSLLTDFLEHDHQFNLKEPSFSDNTANSQYALLQHENTKQFLNSLPETIYRTYRRFQTMGRYLEHGYKLSKTERKSLLDYYHQLNSKTQPLGALGYEWTSLSLEVLLDERDALLAQRSSGELLLPAEVNRLEQIEAHLKSIKPVMAESTELELVAIDLSVPLKIEIKKSDLKRITDENLDSWYNKLDSTPFDQETLKRSIDVLSSKMTDDDFIDHFPNYLKIVVSDNEKLRKPLLDFCTQTLIAKRHISLKDQNSNLPLLCNILYRIANNKNDFQFRQPKSFADLVKITSAYSVPALKVYQAKDVHKKILAKPEDIIVKQKKQARKPIATGTLEHKPFIDQIGMEAGLQKLRLPQKTLFIELIKGYQQVLEKTDGELDTLSKTLTNDLKQSFLVEKEAGKKQRAAEKQKNELAQRLLSDPELVSNLQSTASSAEANIQDQIDHFWSEALKLANQGPDDPKQAKAWAIERESGARATLMKANLMSLYIHAERTHTIEKTGLNAKNAQKLHDLIHSALVHGIRQQSVAKIARTIKKASETNDANLAGQALDVLARSDTPGLNMPAVVLLQHEEQILLHKRQENALQSLLDSAKDSKGFNEVVEKIIMGGGKSKVIIPILAEKKARGDNLVIVEVPHALLATNYEDLNRVSQRLFGKHAYKFEFHRDSNCSPERLEQMYKQFTEIMTNKGYLVTTAEAMQSLELKYLELLLADKDDEISQKQIYWCDKITSLVRNYGDCIIDEVHQGLSIKKKLNYTVGESQPISPSLAKNATALFSLIDPKFIMTAPQLGDDYDWTDFKSTLATQLLNEPTSPLNKFVANAVLKFGPDIKKEILAYLTNSAKTTSKAVLQADIEEKAALAFFKEEISVVLPKTLCGRLNENYGPSKRKNLSPIERTLAIPYAGNNIANERNRFGNALRAINFTIQMMLIKGISEELLIERIGQWQALARQELFQNTTLKHLDETPIAKGFALLVSKLGLTLSEINISDKSQFASLYAHFQYNQALIFDLLQEQSLKQIHHDAEIIHSDSFNHVDLYRSTQGVAGTPYNYTTYHKRLAYNKASSLGTDGYIIEIIRDKNSRVSYVDYKNVYQFVEAALSKSEACARTCAIIDIRATFLGVSNLYVAQEIARYLNSKPGQTIKHVLYFDENQVLCAINLKKPNEPIVLATSDENEIARLLGSAPGERFTYYDQVHTVGVDIKQDDKAHSLVLVDEKTSLQAFLQGSMRMRGLSQDQTMEILVSAGLSSKTYPELIEHFEKVDRENLLQDNLAAAQLQMTNFIRRKCLSMIQDLPSKEIREKRNLSKFFKPFFVDTSSTDLFKLYGGISKPQLVTDILGRHQKQLIASWKKCLESASLSGAFDKEVEQGLQEIIDRAVPHCLKEYDATDDSFAAEVEVQTELQLEKQVEQMILNEFFDAKLKETSKNSWPYNLSSIFYSENKLNLITLPLNLFCSLGREKLNLFSKELRVSKNYAMVYQGQEKPIGAFLKPVFLVWYHLHEGELQATIITPQEADKIAKKIEAGVLTDSWIATTQDTSVAGSQKEVFLNDQRYLFLREQVRFFNGEFGSLLNQDTPLQWLKEEQTTEKLNFFEKTLMPYRPESNSTFQQIKVALTQANVDGFIYIGQHPFEDLSSFDWKKIFPKIIPAQAVEYKKVAEAFVSMNQHWQSKHLDLTELQHQFSLSISSLEYVNKHLNYLFGFKSILDRLDDLSIENPLLDDLTKNEVTFLEAFFGMPISEFYSNKDITPSKSEPKQDELTVWANGDLRVLLMLRAHHAIKGNQSLEKRFNLVIARHVASVDDLKQILKIRDLSEDLILTIIDHQLCDDTVIAALLNINKNLSESLLFLLLEKCQKTELLYKFTSRHDLSEPIINVLLDKAKADIILSGVEWCNSTKVIEKLLALSDTNEDVLSALLDKENLSVQFLLQILKHRAITDEIRRRVYSHKNADRTVRDTLSVHLSPEYLLPVLGSNISIDKSEWLQILKHPTAITKTVLHALVDKSSIDPEVILAVIVHKNTDHSVLTMIIDYQDLSLAVSQKILERKDLAEPSVSYLAQKIFAKCSRDNNVQNLLWEANLVETLKRLSQEQVIDFVKKNKVYPRLGLKLFSQFGEEVLKNITLSELMDEVSQQNDLGLFVSLKRKFENDELQQLAQKIESSSHIDSLLGRTEMTHTIADVLISKKHYSGKIANWNWLTNDQLIFVLDKTSDYDSFYQALIHSNLEKIDRDNWLSTIAAEQSARNKQAARSGDHKEKILAALDVLKVQAYKHAIKSLSDASYTEVARTAFELYHALRQEADTFFNNSNPNLTAFQENCKNAIQLAQPVLNDHRGFKQSILDILNVIVAYVSFRPNTINVGKWRFFEANTASMNLVNKVSSTIDENINPIQIPVMVN